MISDMRVVFESRNRRACSDRALVLTSLQIPHKVVDDVAGCALIVPAEYSARAMDELRLYDQENPPPRPRQARPFVHQNAVPGVIAFVVIVCAVAWLAGESFFARDWLGAGRVDGSLLRAGEWWRTVTALTLHGDLRHLLGNIVFGAFFGFFAGRMVGSGVAWLTILLMAATGNALNALLLESTHRAIGASTAVFAALGLLAGFVWRAKLMSQERWPYRIGPLVGGFALLMYTGTGDENTDVGAHLMGFLCGLGGGMVLAALKDRLIDSRWQRVAAALALALVVIAWTFAFLA